MNTWVKVLVLVLSTAALIITAVSYLTSSESVLKSNKKFIRVPIGRYHITAYKAVSAECGNDKGIGYHGKKIAHQGKPLGRYCATNLLPKGTRIQLPNISGDTIWTVEDHVAEWVDARYHGGIIDLLIDKDSIGLGVQKSDVFIIIEKE